MANKEKIIIELDFDVSDFTQSAADLNKKIAEINKSNKQLDRTTREGALAYQQNTEKLIPLKKELQETNNVQKQLTIANNSLSGSNEQLKAQLSVLTLEYNKLSKAERETSERGKHLNSQINQVTDDLKGNEEAVGNNRRSVGDYGKALSGTPFGSFISGIRAMGAAFLANPIGLVIAALVGAFAALRKAFLSTEEGQNKLGKVFAVFGTIIDKLFDAIEPLANFIFDVVIAAFNELGKAADTAMRIVAAGLDLIGFKDAAQGVRDYVNELEAVGEAAARIADQRAKADVLERDLIVKRGKTEAAIADARERSNDQENVSAEDRQAALKEARKLINELAEAEEERARLLFISLKEELSLTNSTKEQKKELAEAEAALFAVQRKRSEDLKSLNRDEKRVENELKKAAEDKIKAYQDAQKKAIDLNKQQLDLLIAQQGINKKTLQEELKLAETVAAEKIKILDKELKAKLINQTQYQIQLIAIENELLQAQTQLAVDNANRELKIILDANATKIENGQFLNDTLFEQEQQRLNNILEAQKAFEAERLEQGVISQQEYQDNIALVDAQAAQKKADLEAEKKAADEETRIVDLENMLELELQEAENEFERRQIVLDRQKEQELLQAEKIGADKSLIEAKYAKLSKEIEAEKNKAKLTIAANTFDNLATLAGEESEAGKALAIASALINTYLSATAAFSAMASIPIVGPVLGGIAAAAAVATGLKSVNQIRSTKVAKAERGIILGGNPHSRGGTQISANGVPLFEAEKDELLAVVNKKNTKLLNNLNALNTFGGNGDSFFARGGLKSFADGGVALSSLSGGVEQSQKQLNETIAAIQSMPNPVVAVQDINEIQSDTRRTEVRATI